MRLDIINYITTIGSPPKMVETDEEIVKFVSKTVNELDMGEGIILVSDVVHIGNVNLNYRMFMEENVEEYIKTFYRPNFTPFLVQHEDNNIPAGRNIISKYIKKQFNTEHGRAKGLIKVGTFVPYNVHLSDGSTVINALQSRRLLGVSQSARINPQNRICSICNTPLYEEECKHYVGEIYDGKLAYMKLYDPQFVEYSAVNNPANLNTIIRTVKTTDENGGPTFEASDIVLNSMPNNINVYDSYKKSYRSVDIKGENMDIDNIKDSIAAIVKEQIQDAKNDDISELTKKYQDFFELVKQMHEDELAARIEELKEKDKIILSLSKALNLQIDNNNGDSDNNKNTTDKISGTTDNDNDNSNNNETDNEDTRDNDSDNNNNDTVIGSKTFKTLGTGIKHITLPKE